MKSYNIFQLNRHENNMPPELLDPISFPKGA
jgi:hypothetical protein